MDPSERREFIRGETNLALDELGPEEVLLAFEVAIGLCRPLLHHLPMTPVTDIAKSWQTLIVGDVRPVGSIRAANVPVRTGVEDDARLMPLHSGKSIDTVNPEDPTIRTKRFLYLSRKGGVVEWKVQLQDHPALPESTKVSLLTPTHFLTISEIELWVLVQQDQSAFVEAIGWMIHAAEYAHRRRVKIADELQTVSQNLRALSARIGVPS